MLTLTTLLCCFTHTRTHITSTHRCVHAYMHICTVHTNCTFIPKQIRIHVCVHKLNISAYIYTHLTRLLMLLLLLLLLLLLKPLLVLQLPIRLLLGGTRRITSRHTVVCRAAKKAGDHTVSIFTGRKKTAFLCMHSSMAPSLKHTIFAL